jgi:hypothetical protein
VSKRFEWHLSKYEPFVCWRCYWHGTDWFDVLWGTYVVLPQHTELNEAALLDVIETLSLRGLQGRA